jgi:hypothetical protein
MAETMTRVVKWTFAAMAVTLGATAPAVAQDVPRADVSVGYQLLEFKVPDADDETMSKGWYADVAGNLTRNVALVFQIGGSYKEDTATTTVGGVTVTATGDVHVHQFMGGVRVSARTRTVVPFGEFLAGGINGSAKFEGSVVGDGETLFSTSDSESSTEFAVQAAGGATIMLTERFGVRGTVGYLRMFAEEEGVNIIRVAGGAVFAF